MTSPSHNGAMILLSTYGITGGLILLGIGVGWYIGSRQNPDGMDDTSFMPFAARCTFLFWAWVIAAFATVLIEIPLLAFFPMFPAGLAYVISGQEMEGSLLMMAVGWFIYSVITSLAMVAKRRVFYFVIYGILCLLLVLNVKGCHQILKMVQ
jgi:hypothetical protein